MDEDGQLEWASLEKRCRAFYEGFKSLERALATLLYELEAGFVETVDEPLVVLPRTRCEVDEVEVQLLADQGLEERTRDIGQVGVVNQADKAHL